MCQINTSVMKKQVGCVDVHGKWCVWWRFWFYLSVLVCKMLQTFRRDLRLQF
jgi:hypothetical protein